MTTRTCPNCGSKFIDRSGHKTYCKADCQKEYYYKTKIKPGRYNKRPPKKLSKYDKCRQSHDMCDSCPYPDCII